MAPHRSLANGLIPVGSLRWVSASDLLPPSPRGEDPDESRVLRYLEQCYVHEQVYFTPETNGPCRLCANGARFASDPAVTDGYWWFSFHLPHYIRVHHYRLPEHVIESLRRRDFAVPSLRTSDDAGGRP